MKKLAAILLLAALLPCASYAQWQKAYTVAGRSMEPTLEPGDTVVVEETQAEDVKRGELVAIGFRGRPGLMVKRIAAVPGDRVEIIEGELLVNGKPHEPRSSVDPERWGPALKQLERYGWTVPDRMVFILGDNQNNSRDSRRLGLISLEQIKGRVLKIGKQTKKGRDK